MSRYQTALAIQDDNTKKYKSNTVILNVPTDDTNDIHIQTTSPERLDLLAYDFYTDVSSWWVIAAANGLVNGSLWVPANTVLRIPFTDKLNDYILKVNNER